MVRAASAGSSKSTANEAFAAYGEMVEGARLHSRASTRITQRILVTRAIETVHSAGCAVRHGAHLLAIECATVATFLHALLVQLAAALLILTLEQGLCGCVAINSAASDGASVAR